METNDAPKEVRPANTRGRKPSKWQLTPCKLGVYDGANNIYYDDEKKAKAVVAYARSFGYIPEAARVRNY